MNASPVTPTALPTVSVVIPCFSAGHLLDEAIASILAQDGPFDLLEVLVVDDHSPDAATHAALARAAAKPKVQVLKNTRKRGPAGARNTGAFVASGEWLAFLDADDVWLERSLFHRVDALRLFPQARFVTGDFQIQQMSTGHIERNFFESRERPLQYYRPAYDRGSPALLLRPFSEVLKTVLAHSCSSLIARSLFQSVGGFEESLRYKEDTHLWFKLAKETDFVLVPHSLFLYRQHGSNMTRAEVPPFEYERLMLQVIAKTDDLDALIPDLRHHYSRGHAANAAHFRMRGLFLSGLMEAAKSISYTPWLAAGWKHALAALLRIR